MGFHEATMSFNVVTFGRTGAEWAYRIGSTEICPIFHRGLDAWLPAAGFGRVRFYGSYEGVPFDPQASGDLIAVAIKHG